jgi:uncharacterized membrane protein SpoIIM required for sporulation
MAERFITLIDDLSYSKTFYPKSKATRWINGITASIYQDIYRNRKEKYGRIFQFWKYELPLLFRKYHRVLFVTTVIFILFVAIGYFSASRDPGFLRSVLGDDYVDNTENNITKGDPFGIYKDESPFNMFARIAYNNIFVSFRMFIGGFSLGLFTLVDLWRNGIMLGAFHELFFANGLGLRSILVVWIHGTIEIASIIIAGASGFILANGILFPGTFSRRVSFMRGAKDAMKILICLIPFFIVAAFLESYITHLMSETYDKTLQNGMPPWVAVLILLSSLLLITWYFIIYPIRLGRRGYFIAPDGLVSRLNEANA